jgi:hypothetical protein
MASSNSLGLELDVANMSVSDSKNTQKGKKSVPDPAGDAAGVEGDGSGGPVPGSDTQTDQNAEKLADDKTADAKDREPKKDKPAPYINPDRVATGGAKPVSDVLVPPSYVSEGNLRRNFRMMHSLNEWLVSELRMRRFARERR